MKRIPCALAALLLAISLTGCADWPDQASGKDPEPAIQYDGAVIDVESQTVILYMGGEPVRTIPVIQGIPDAS